MQHTEECFHLKIKYLINMMRTEVRQVIDMNKKISRCWFLNILTRERNEMYATQFVVVEMISKEN